LVIVMPDADTIVRLAFDNSDGVTEREIGAALETLALIRQYIDRLERQIASCRITHHDDYGGVA
jgi:hypothetical protein